MLQTDRRNDEERARIAIVWSGKKREYARIREEINLERKPIKPPYRKVWPSQRLP